MLGCVVAGIVQVQIQLPSFPLRTIGGFIDGKSAAGRGIKNITNELHNNQGMPDAHAATAVD